MSLSDRTLDVFREGEAIRVGELLFPSRKPGAPINRRTFAILMPRIGGRPRLALTVRNAVEAAYARSDLFERRRKAIQQWSDCLAQSGATNATAPERPDNLGA